MNKYLKKITSHSVYNKMTKKISQIEKRALQRPFLSLAIALGVLLAVMSASSYLNRPKPEVATPEIVKKVNVYSVGEAPRLQVSAKVEASNVITIVSQAGGVVSNVGVKPGQKVARGTRIISLSSNYYGDSAASIQRELAQVQYNNVVDSYDAQVELIAKQKNLAEQQKDNAQELRIIADKSIENTKSLLSLNESILAGVDASLNTATDSATISSLTAQKATLLAGINQIKSGLRQAEYAADDQSPAAHLANNGKNIAVEQLDLQLKSLAMGKEISTLQLQLARIQESTMYPATPFSGVVERVFVTPGQMVAPGTPLATINANTGATQLIVKVSKDLATKVSQVLPTYVEIEGTQVEIYPDHISGVATDGGLYSIVYTLAPEYTNKLSNNLHVSVSLPIQGMGTNSVIPFLPLESVHQSQTESTVFVIKDGVVGSQAVTLGSISGSFIEIKSGLNHDTLVVLDRNVVDGQKVEAK